MAKTSAGPDSATNQWFFNLANNASNLDNQNGGFTVFGRVLGSGMSVIDRFEELNYYNFGSPFDNLPLVSWDGVSDLTTANLAAVEHVELIGQFPGDGGSVSQFNISTRVVGESELVTVSEIDGVLVLDLEGLGVGDSEIEVTVSDYYGHYVVDTFRVLVTSDVVSIVSQPIGRAAMPGENVVLSVVASSNVEASFQWHKNGVPIVGAVEPQLVLNNVTSEDAAFYDVVVGGPGGYVSSDFAEVEIVSEYSRLVNISTRGYVGIGDEVMIAGVTTVGEEPGAKSVLLRAVGPGLASTFGVPMALADPELNIYVGASVTNSNGDWGADPEADENRSMMARVGAFVLEEGSKDSAVSFDFEGSVFTGIFGGVNGGTGIGLVECYDVDEDPLTANVRISNLSTRAEVRTGAQVTIAGFVVDGETAINLLIRGVGPSLDGIVTLTNGSLLENPHVDLYRIDEVDGAVLIASNDDWEQWPSYHSVEALSEDVGAFALADGSKDAAMFVTLEPGSYSVFLSGVDSGTGIGLVEFYEVRGKREADFDLSEVDVLPSVITQVAPVYPVEFTEQHISGWVELEWVIMKDGSVSSVMVVSSSHVEFESGIVEAIGQSTWDPAMKNGVAVNARVKQRIMFNVGD